MRVKDNFEVLLRFRSDQITLTPNLLKILSEYGSPQEKKSLEWVKENLKATDLIEHLRTRSSELSGENMDIEQVLNEFRSEWEGFVV